MLDKLNAALKAALKDPEFIKREEALGAVVVTDARVNGAEHKKFVEAEIAKWGAGHQGGRAVRRLKRDRSSRGLPAGGPASAHAQRDRHRPVVDEVHLHVGAELAAGDVRVLGARGRDDALVEARGRARAARRR